MKFEKQWVMMVVWDVMSCGLVDGYYYAAKTYSLHLWGYGGERDSMFFWNDKPVPWTTQHHILEDFNLGKGKLENQCLVCNQKRGVNEILIEVSFIMLNII